MSVWINPTTISAGIQAGSSLLGGLMGGGQKRTRYQDLIKGLLGTKINPATGKMYNYSEALAIHEGNIMKGRQKAGKELGLHPLVVAGMNPSGGVTLPVTQDNGSNGLGEGIAEMGQGIASAVRNHKSKEQQKIEDILTQQTIEKGELELERMRTENILAKQGAARTLVSEPFIQGQGDDPRYPNQASMPMGLGDTAPILRQGKDKHGRTVDVYNDELGDNEVLQALYAITHSLPDIAANAGQAAGEWLRKPRFKKSWWTGNHK